MYRVTIYDSSGDKSVEEMNDEDMLRERVNDCMNDLENRGIKTFTVSWISNHVYTKPFWE